MSLTCGDLINRGRILYADRPALSFEDKTFTFAEQAARMFRLANALLGKGIVKQERVAILARNRSEYVEIFGACEVTGLIAINLNSRLSEVELGAICQDCQPTVLIYAKEFAAIARTLRAQVASLRMAIAIDPSGADEVSYEDLLAGASTHVPRSAPAADDIAYLMYTSGTTGGAKGVMIRHGAMVEAIRVLSHEGGVASINKGLIVMPLFHLGGKIEQMAFSLMGAAIVLKAAFEPEDILATIQRERIEAAHFAPLMIQRMLDVLELKSYDLTSLRCVHYASAPMPVPLLRRALDRMGPIFAQVYGMTECICGTILKPPHHLTERVRRRAPPPWVGGPAVPGQSGQNRRRRRHGLRAGSDR